MPDNTKIVNLQQLKDHIDGIGTLDRHEASKIDLNPSITILGDELLNVQEALEKIKSAGFPVVPDATENVKGIVRLAGDLRGNSTDLVDVSNPENDIAPRVRGLQGYSVANLRPLDGYVLTWDEEMAWWQPKPALGSGSFNYATPFRYGIVRLSDGTYPGDIGGTAGNLTIRGFQSYPLTLAESGNPLYPDQYLKWDGNSWINSYLPVATFNQLGIVKLGGDIGGTADNLQVIGLQGTPLDVTCANNGDAIVYDAAQGTWTCGQANLGFTLSEDVAPGTSGGVKVVGLDKRPIYHQDTINNYDILTFYNGTWSAAPARSATSTTEGVIRLTNDLGGASNAPLVVGFYDNPLDQATMSSPPNRSLIQYISTEGPGNGSWKAVSPDSVISFSEDLTGNYLAQRCIGWYGAPLDTTYSSPAQGDMPIYDGSKWILTSNPNQSGNPEVRTFYFNGVRNTYKRYQIALVTEGLSQGNFLTYELPSNSGTVMIGKIIARVVDDSYTAEINPVWAPNPNEDSNENPNLSSEDSNLKFDLGNLKILPVYQYNLEAGYCKTKRIYVDTGVETQHVSRLQYISGGTYQENITLRSTFPYPFPYSNGLVTNVIHPDMSLSSQGAVVIRSGAVNGAIVHWTLHLDVYENGQ